ncbi:MAG: hypothetical protein WHT06_05560 [Desulfobacterales bacterium]
MPGGLSQLSPGLCKGETAHGAQKVYSVATSAAAEAMVAFLPVTARVDRKTRVAVIVKWASRDEPPLPRGSQIEAGIAGNVCYRSHVESPARRELTISRGLVGRPSSDPIHAQNFSASKKIFPRGVYLKCGGPSGLEIKARSLFVLNRATLAASRRSSSRFSSCMAIPPFSLFSEVKYIITRK